MSTLSVLILLPLVFAIIQKKAPLYPRSLHPEDYEEHKDYTKDYPEDYEEHQVDTKEFPEDYEHGGDTAK
jgi:hypothetical protein